MIPCTASGAQAGDIRTPMSPPPHWVTFSTSREKQRHRCDDESQRHVYGGDPPEGAKAVPGVAASG